MPHSKDQTLHRLNLGSNKSATFHYEQFGVKGVGRRRLPIINMDEFVGHSMDDAIHKEICIGLATSTEFRMGTFFGPTVPEEETRIGGKCWTDVMEEIEARDPTGVHRDAIEAITKMTTDKSKLVSNLFKYAYFAMGAYIPWFFTLYLKEIPFGEKTNEGRWLPEANRFPKLKAYIRTLPFKVTGRILFFTTYPNVGVVTHRDWTVSEHKDHNINFFFNKGRPSYIWDEVTKQKTYLDPSAKSYYFNNRDYHGVDSEPEFRYTLRVDGTFTDELQEKLGLEDGYTWKWDYENS